MSTLKANRIENLTTTNGGIDINNSGNVGVGTASPQSILHLAGSSPQLILDGGSGNTNPVSINSWWTNTPIVFKPGDTERMRIDGAGRLLVGSTGNTGANLFVAGGSGQSVGTEVDIARFFASTASSINSGGLTIGGVWHNTDVNQRIAYLQSEQGNNPGNTARRLALNPGGGNVGIGTKLPSQHLQVEGSGSQYIAVTSTDSDNTGVLFGDSDIDSGYVLYANADNSLRFGANAGERMRITSGGYFKASNNGSYISSSSDTHEFNHSGVTETLTVRATNSSYSSTVNSLFATRAATSAYWFIRGVSASGGAGADNEFYIRGDGNAFADGSWSGGGADYAEYFEWSDGNTEAEDRRGISVVLDGDKIREAVAGEEPIGVISGHPSVVGDADMDRWKGKYLRDDYGSYVLNEDGYRQLNPDFDSSVEYVQREDRPEWDTVGLMGKLRIRKGQVTGTRWIKMRDVSDTVEEWLVR